MMEVVVVDLKDLKDLKVGGGGGVGHRQGGWRVEVVVLQSCRWGWVGSPES